MSMTLKFHLLKVGHCSHPECVTQRGGKLSAAEFPALVGLLIHPTRGPMLFDTGYSKAFYDATQPFPERFYRWVTPFTLPSDEVLTTQLARYGYVPEDIRHVFVSHMHADHVSGLTDFPKATLFAMRAEVNAMRRRSRIGALRRGFLTALLPNDFDTRVRFVEDARLFRLPVAMAPFTEGFDLLGDQSVVGVPLPGHTAGQMGIWFYTEGERQVFLIADACWSIGALAQNRPPSWIANQLFADKDGYARTFDGLRRLLSANENLMMIPSHCNATWERLGRDDF